MRRLFLSLATFLMLLTTANVASAQSFGVNFGVGGWGYPAYRSYYSAPYSYSYYSSPYWRSYYSYPTYSYSYPSYYSYPAYSYRYYSYPTYSYPVYSTWGWW